MARQVVVVLYVLALMAVVVSVDILFLRYHFTERLIANDPCRLHHHIAGVQPGPLIGI